MIHCSKNIICPTNFNFLNQTGFIRRAGVIPYIIDRSGKTFVLLGLSKEENSVWADLGGRAEPGETTLQTAVREFKEESRSVLPFDMSQVTKVLISGDEVPDQAILFMYIEPSHPNLNINSKFLSTEPKTKYEDEMQYLQWIEYHDFLNMTKVSRSIKQLQQILKHLNHH